MSYRCYSLFLIILEKLSLTGSLLSPLFFKRILVLKVIDTPEFFLASNSLPAVELLTDQLVTNILDEVTTQVPVGASNPNSGSSTIRKVEKQIDESYVQNAIRSLSGTPKKHRGYQVAI